MKTKPVVSRYSAYQVPEDWVAMTPLAWSEPGERADRLSASVVEYWLEDAPTAARFAELRRPTLEGSAGTDVEIVAEGPHDARGRGDGATCAYRCRDDDGSPAIGRKVWLLTGPLVCELTIAGKEAGPDPERDRIVDAIVRSFTLENVDFFAKAERLALVPRGSDGSPSETGTDRRAAPFLTVALPLVPDWRLETPEDASYVRGASELRVTRVLDSDGDPGAWLGLRLQEIQAAKGSVVHGWDRGELEGRGPYAAILWEPRGLERTWSSQGVRRRLELLLSIPIGLRFTAEAYLPETDDAIRMVRQVVLGLAPLPRPEWQTRVAAPWLDLVLEGPWLPQGGGTYLEPDRRLLLLATEVPSATPLARLRPSLLAGLRRSDPAAGPPREEEELMSWRGYEAFQYARDASPSDGGGGESVRAIWLSAEGLLRSLVVLTAGGDEVAPLFAAALAAVRKA